MVRCSDDGTSHLRSRVITIRRAGVSDAAGVQELIRALLHYAVPQRGLSIPADFAAQFSAEALFSVLGSSNHRYQVAVCRRQLIGVIGVRDNSHLLHFFVAESHHGQGIGRQLWNRAREVILQEAGRLDITVNSSSYAVDIYRRFGFECVGPAVTGPICYQPMRTVEHPGRAALADAPLDLPRHGPS